MPNLAVILIGCAFALLVIILLIWKNHRDKKELNPNAEDALEESRMDHERNREKL